MATSSVSVRTTNTTSGQASAEIRAPTGVRPKLLEVSYIQAAATVQSVALARPQAIGVTPSSQTVFSPDDPNDPQSVLQVALAWNTSPTAPLVYMRRWNSTNIVGVGVVWTFPRGLVIPPQGNTLNVASSIVVWNVSTGVASDLYVVADE